MSTTSAATILPPHASPPGTSYVKRVATVDFTGCVCGFSCEEHQFPYSRSRIQQPGVVVEVKLALEAGDVTALTEEMETIVTPQAARFPEDPPECASTFLLDPAMPSSARPSASSPLQRHEPLFAVPKPLEPANQRLGRRRKLSPRLQPSTSCP